MIWKFTTVLRQSKPTFLQKIVADPNPNPNQLEGRI